MSIIVNMACGLANRMFQYAYFQNLLKQGVDAKVHYFTSTKLAHEDVAWNRIFPNAELKKASTLDVLMIGGHDDIVSKLVRKFMPWMTRVTEMPTAFSLYELSDDVKDKDRYLLGVFQSAGVVAAVEDVLRESFQFDDFTDERNIRILSEIMLTDSVSIHVRKGLDYQRIKWYRNTCDIDYYRRAVAYVKKHCLSPTFYVFTDNPEWVHDNFTDFEYKLISGNPLSGWGSHFDMQLMSQCRHNIISNSTYSWWGGFLNNHPDKIVVMPKLWFNPDVTPEPSSAPLRYKDWITL